MRMADCCPPHTALLYHLDGAGLGEGLDLGDGLLEELLLESRLGELGSNGGSDGLDKGGLLNLTLLLLVADPRVEDGLELVLDSGLLGEDKVVVLDLVGLLGDSVELLGEGNNVLELGDGVDAVSHSLGVLLAGTVEDALNAVNVAVGPGRVGGTNVLGDSAEDDEEGDGEDGLLVGDLEESVES